jgi:hypothetical protein
VKAGEEADAERTDEEADAERTDEDALVAAATDGNEMEVVATAVAALGEWQGILEEEGVVADLAFLETLAVTFLLDQGTSSSKLAPLALFAMIWECHKSAEKCKDVSIQFAQIAAMQWVLPNVGKIVTKVGSKITRIAKLMPKPGPGLRLAFKQVRAIRDAARVLTNTGKSTAKLNALAQKVGDAAAKRVLKSRAASAIRSAAKEGAKVAEKAAATLTKRVAAASKGASAAKSALAATKAVMAAEKVAVAAGKMAAVAAAKQAAAKLLSMLGGPVGVAIMIAQIGGDVAGAVLDAKCVGNFAEKCHPDAESLLALSTEYQYEFNALMRNGAEQVNAKEWAYVPPIDDVVAENIRAATARRVRARVLNENIFKLTGGHGSLNDWVVALKKLSKEKQFSALMSAKHFLDKRCEIDIAEQQAVDVCQKTPGAKWLPTLSACSVQKSVCCSRVDAARRMIAFADADNAGMACMKLAVFATNDVPEFLVDLLMDFVTEMGSIPLSRAAFQAWTPVPKRGEGLYDRAVRLTLVQALSGKHDGLLDGKDPAARARDAVFRTYTSVGGKEVDDVLDKATQWPGPSNGGQLPKENKQWLHSHPTILLLSRRWVPLAPNGHALAYDVDHDAACGGAYEDGLCLPDYKQLMRWHVCPFVRAGEWDEKATEHRNFDSDSEGHIYDWKKDTCMPSTEYCEAYSRFPASTDAACTSGEKAKLGVATAAFIAGSGMALSLMGPFAITPIGILAAWALLSGGPKQCDTQRDACRKANAGASGCSCYVPSHLEPWKFIGAETIVLGANKVSKMITDR